jgi:hypothetical protein
LGGQLSFFAVVSTKQNCQVLYGVSYYGLKHGISNEVAEDNAKIKNFIT